MGDAKDHEGRLGPLPDGSVNGMGLSVSFVIYLFFLGEKGVWCVPVRSVDRLVMMTTGVLDITKWVVDGYGTRVGGSSRTWLRALIFIGYGVWGLIWFPYGNFQLTHYEHTIR